MAAVFLVALTQAPFNESAMAVAESRVAAMLHS